MDCLVETECYGSWKTAVNIFDKSLQVVATCSCKVSTHHSNTPLKLQMTEAAFFFVFCCCCRCCCCCCCCCFFFFNLDTCTATLLQLQGLQFELDFISIVLQKQCLHCANQMEAKKPIHLDCFLVACLQLSLRCDTTIVASLHFGFDYSTIVFLKELHPARFDCILPVQDHHLFFTHMIPTSLSLSLSR